MSTLIASNLQKSIRRRPVVHNLSLTLVPGEIHGLLGPNGAGKTITFAMLVGLERPDSGQIHIDQTDVTLLPLEKRVRYGLGYLPQQSSIFRELTVRENLMSGMQILRTHSVKAMREKTEQLLKEFALEHIANSKGIKLSGGEKRRVEIARALACNPKYLLLDEPFSGVDPIAVGGIASLLTHLRDQGLGILITDHNVRETMSLCSHVYILNKGEVVIEGSPETIQSSDIAKTTFLGGHFQI